MQTVTNLVGWLSALVLMITLTRQIVVQWRNRTSKGVSPWLFVGQLSASIGFIVYSMLVHNVVFVITNALIALIAIIGECVDIRNRRLQKPHA